MRLRQVVLVAQELDAVVDAVCQALGVEVCYRDPGVAEFGIHNALMPIGDAFVEVVSPVMPGTPAGRYLERRAGDGGYMVLLQCDDLDAERRRLQALGVRIVWEGSGAGIQGMHLHPADVGGAIVSLDVARPAASWGWAGSDWQRFVHDDVVREIAAVEVQGDDHEALAQRWSAVVGRPLRAGDEPGERLIDLDQGRIRFARAADGRGDGIGGLDLVAASRSRAGERMDIGGVRVRLV